MKKVLVITEASYLETGYAKYGRELLRRLSKENCEVAELACYHQIGNLEHESKEKMVPWKMFPTVPAKNTEAFNVYNSNPTLSFGSMAFEETLLQFPADYVISFRDYWFDEFIHRSPFRKYFNHLQLAPVDAEPQNPLWLEFYGKCDGVFTYTDWGKEVLERENIKVYGSSAYPADEKMIPLNKSLCKQKLGIPQDSIIIGTVNRNQPRKLYDELFKTFAKFSETNPNVYLYCHTSVVDQGYDIPALLIKYGISNKVYFTYKCCDRQPFNGCGNISTRLYSNNITVCYNCGNMSTFTAGPNNFCTEEELCLIFNTFDIYTQFCSSEGLGMGQIEAAACGKPVVSTDYSAMSDVVRKLGGYPVSVLTKKLDMQTGRDFAIPDGNDLIRGWKTVFRDMEKYSRNAYSGYKTYYTWENMAKPWLNCVNELPVKGWGNPNIKPIAEFNIHHGLSNKKYAQWIIVYVLGEQEKLGTLYEHNMITNLDRGAELIGERLSPFNREVAYNRARQHAEFRNVWERRRLENLTNRPL